MRIKVIGSYKDHSGYGEATRNTIVALGSFAKVSLKEMSFTPDKIDMGEVGKKCLELEKNEDNSEIVIVELTPNFFNQFVEPFKKMVGTFFWEVEGMITEWVWNCNRMDMIWIHSKYHQKQLTERLGVTRPVLAIPQAMDTKKHTVKPFKIKGFKGFLFYSIFQWTERKNPRALVETFWKTFKGKKNVGLLIKTYRSNFGELERQSIINDINKWKKDFKGKLPPIFLELNLLSNDQMWRLHATGDCFVSAHRGEGWGMPQAEAMLMGNPIISTNFGGIHDWLNSELAWLVGYKMVNVFGMGHIPWYSGDYQWAEINREALRSAFLSAFNHPKLLKEKGRKSQAFVRKNFSYKAVAEQMKEALGTL